MKKAWKNVLVAILALWAVLGFSLHINPEQNFVQMLTATDHHDEIQLFSSSPALEANFSETRIVWLFVYVFLFGMIQKAFAIREKRLMIISSVLAILFSVFQVVGESITYYLSIDGLFAHFGITLLKLIGLCIAYDSCIATLFLKMANRKKEGEEKEFSFFTANRKSIFVVIGILSVCWLPYFLKEFPGIIQPDSINQIKQAIGETVLNRWHPVVHTLLIKIFVGIGNGLFHSMNAGVALYTIFQMLFMATIFSISIGYMAKKKVPIGMRIASLLYFAFCPGFPLLSISMLKDTLFAGMMVLLTIVFIEIMTNTENFLKSKGKIIGSVIIIVFTSLLRNNALYMLILVTPFVLLYKKGKRVQIGGILIGSIILVFGINFLIGHVFHIPREDAKTGLSGEVEMYSVPLQQMARVLVDHYEVVSKEEKEQIGKFFVDENFYKNYQEFLADPMKTAVSTEYFTEHKGEFIGLWFRLLGKYPGSYIDSFLCMTSGYFDPGESRNSIGMGIFPNDLGIEAKPITNGVFVNFVEELAKTQNIPILGLFFNAGFVLWIILLLIGFHLYQKQYEICFVFLPIIGYLLTVLLGPLNNEYRYVFYEFTCLPIFTAYALKDRVL